MTSIEYFYNANGEVGHYEYDDVLYVSTFPIDWATEHIEGTGPKECNNCKYYGSWDNVFLGYCGNCARYIYNGKRGMGFIDQLDEMNPTDPRSATLTYLKGLDIDSIRLDANINRQGLCDDPECKFCNTADNEKNEIDEIIEWMEKRHQEMEEASIRLHEEWIKYGMDDLYDDIQYYG